MTCHGNNISRRLFLLLTTHSPICLLVDHSIWNTYGYYPGDSSFCNLSFLLFTCQLESANFNLPDLIIWYKMFILNLVMSVTLWRRHSISFYLTIFRLLTCYFNKFQTVQRLFNLEANLEWEFHYIRYIYIWKSFTNYICKSLFYESIIS